MSNSILKNEVEGKLEIKGLSGESLDILEEKINKIKEIFPEAICEGKIDFERLSEELGHFKEDKEERYRFEWAGKSQAIKIAQTPSMGTLRPCKEESKNWDTTQNLYIEGDNLEVLKLLQKSYQNKIKMIYIDPPYNTGNDFVYKDDFKDNIENYLKITGQKDSNGNNVSTNKETNGRYHSDWLNMMYPRLKIARSLLKEDGIIFISIDDNEVINLRKICDEILGEENFISTIIWKKKVFDNNDNIPALHEYALVYCKNISKIKLNLLPRTEEQLSKYKNPDNDSRGAYYFEKLSVNTSGGRYSKATDFEIINPEDGKSYSSPTGNWRFGKETILRMIQEGRIDFSASLPRYRVYLEDVKQGVSANTWWDDCGQNLHAAKEIKNLFGEKVFETPKPIEFLKRMVYLATENDEIILDFFSGSASLAHATVKQNFIDGKKRRYILVQIPTKLGKGKFPNICEIGKERIRRAGDKIVAENKDKDGIEDLDIGFKVFKLDSSNIKRWNPNYDNIEQTLDDMEESFVKGRTEDDILYELMLKAGIDITYLVEEVTVNDKKIFNIGFGELLVCLDDDITIDIANEIVNFKNDRTKVIFKEVGFKDDSAKTNVLEILKRNKIKEVISV